MKKKSGKKKTLIIILIIILLVITGSVLYTFSYLNKVKTVKISKKDKDLGINTQTNDNMQKSSNTKNKVTNILLMGIDNEENASDSIIVVTIDETASKIKLTSIMRDTYVDLGQNVHKINYAYHFGGPEFAIKTVNENFQLDIRDYVKVDFKGLSAIIDALDGVQLEIKDYEIGEMKAYGITKPGIYNLKGYQALGYCRIRHEGQWDYERTLRQRTVLTKIFEKVKKSGVQNYPSVIAKVLPYVETSLSKTGLLTFSSKIATMNNLQLQQSRVPYDDLHTEVIIDNLFYIKWDKQQTIDRLHNFIYNDVNP